MSDPTGDYEWTEHGFARSETFTCRMAAEEWDGLKSLLDRRMRATTGDRDQEGDIPFRVFKKATGEEICIQGVRGMPGEGNSVRLRCEGSRVEIEWSYTD